MTNARHQFRQAGFTLVEILAAVLIISILAGLFFVAGRAAISFFRGVNDKADLDNIVKALELYKIKYGEYPPDGKDLAAIQRQLAKQDSKLIGNELEGQAGYLFEWACQLDTASKYYNKSGSLLTYWLCGLNWSEPRASQTGESEFIELKPGFKEEKEVGSAKPGVNYNIHDKCLCNSKGYPILYFRAAKQPDTGEMGYNVKDVRHGIHPYAKKGGGWYNPDSYQLILPGEDGDFSTPADNVTNFAAGATMADEEYQPQ